MVCTRTFFGVGLIGVVLCTSDLAGQQRTLLGRIAAVGTGDAVPQVAVQILSSGLRVHTNATGQFQLEGITDTVVTIEFVRIGFQPLTLTIRFLEEHVVGDLGTIEMTPLATRLDPIHVDTEGLSPRLALAGFYERRQIGIGTFVDESQIEKWTPVLFTDIVPHVGGFSVRWNLNYGRPLPPELSAFGSIVRESSGARDMRRYVIASRRGRSNCPIAIIVDGVQVGTTLDTDIDRIVKPADIEGLEMYSGPSQLPAKFSVQNVCGALVVWMR